MWFQGCPLQSGPRPDSDIEDNVSFFDTELLVLAFRGGLRINEVPVRWLETTILVFA